MGTPNDQTWPGVTTLQDWNDEFPVWPQLALHKFCTNMSEEGIDLLELMLAMDPRRRITARDAMSHVYFADINETEM
jgi:serine/threonine protein kinase